LHPTTCSRTTPSRDAETNAGQPAGTAVVLAGVGVADTAPGVTTPLAVTEGDASLAAGGTREPPMLTVHPAVTTMAAQAATANNRALFFMQSPRLTRV